MKLYDYWRSTAAYRVRIALNLKGISWESVAVDLVKDGGEQHRGWYTAINPQELVPSLELDNGRVIGQSMAIIEYLDETTPEPPLLPEDPEQRARVRQLAQVVALDMHPLNNLRVLNYLKQEFSCDQSQVTAWYHNWLQKGCDTLEALIDSNGAFATGHQVSLADVVIVPQLYNAHRFEFNLEHHPKLRRVEDACLALDAFAEAAPDKNGPASTK